MTVPMEICFVSLRSRCFPRLRPGKHQDSRETKRMFPSWAVIKCILFFIVVGFAVLILLKVPNISNDSSIKSKSSCRSSSGGSYSICFSSKETFSAHIWKDCDPGPQNDGYDATIWTIRIFLTPLRHKINSTHVLPWERLDESTEPTAAEDHKRMCAHPSLFLWVVQHTVDFASPSTHHFYIR